MAERYNGWTNYETWNVALWIDNEQGSYSYWRDRARECYKWAVDRGTGLDKTEQAKIDLADALKEEIEEGNPLADQASFYADILRANLSEVNYHEIAGNLIDEIKSES